MSVCYGSLKSHGKAEGRIIDGVTITEPYNMQYKVGYAIGVLKLARTRQMARGILSISPVMMHRTYTQNTASSKLIKKN